MIISYLHSKFRGHLYEKKGKIVAEIYPENEIILCDSLCASLGQGALVYYACKQKEKGYSPFSLLASMTYSALSVIMLV